MLKCPCVDAFTVKVISSRGPEPPLMLGFANSFVGFEGLLETHSQKNSPKIFAGSEDIMTRISPLPEEGPHMGESGSTEWVNLCQLSTNSNRFALCQNGASARRVRSSPSLKEVSRVSCNFVLRLGTISNMQNYVIWLSCSLQRTLVV